MRLKICARMRRVFTEPITIFEVMAKNENLRNLIFEDPLPIRNFTDFACALSKAVTLY